MKKVLCLALALIMMFSCASVAFAGTACDCSLTPVIYIRGFGEELYENPESEERTPAMKTDTETLLSCVPDLLLAVTAKAAKDDYDSLMLHVENIADKIIGKIKCDKSGNSKYNVGIEPRELPTEDNHDTASYGFAVSHGDLPDAEFEFHYDWRLDPIENTKKLRELTEYVKELTGHDKVTLVAHSQGNTLVATYLYLYGSKDIDKLLFLSPAFQGLSIMGSLFAGESVIDDKGDMLVKFVDSVLGEKYYENLISSLLGVLNNAGVVDAILADAQIILDKEFKKVYAEYLLDALVTMPGFWSFVPDEYYDRAKEFTFTGTEGYDELIRKIDEYHYNVQTKLTTLLDEAKANGVNFAIGCGYGISSIPLSDSATQHSDMTIDTKYMSIGATCAPFGSTFGDGYVQAVDDGHSHLSPDLEIDASTAAYPDYTWFVKGQLHPDFSDGYCEWMEWVLLYDGQPTVYSDKNFPQFTSLEGSVLEEIEAPEDTTPRPFWKMFIDMFAVIWSLFAKLFSL